MRSTYDSAISVLDAAHRKLASLVPPPQVVTVSGTEGFRYMEETPQQAIVLKTAAAISRLRASLVLLDAGFLLEQGALNRTIDEINEDVLFISLALIHDTWTPHHDQFMSAFFDEEFTDAANIVATRRPRNLVSRRKVRAFIANESGTDDPYRDISVADTIGSLYSGYVHGAAQHILDCYGGYPPRFHLAGLQGTPLVADHTEDAWNYVFRTLHAMAIAFAAIGHEHMFEHMRKQVLAFQTITGRSA